MKSQLSLTVRSWAKAHGRAHADAEGLMSESDKAEIEECFDLLRTGDGTGE